MVPEYLVELDLDIGSKRLACLGSAPSWTAPPNRSLVENNHLLKVLSFFCLLDLGPHQDGQRPEGRPRCAWKWRVAGRATSSIIILKKSQVRCRDQRKFDSGSFCVIVLCSIIVQVPGEGIQQERETAQERRQHEKPCAVEKRERQTLCERAILCIVQYEK